MAGVGSRGPSRQLGHGTERPLCSEYIVASALLVTRGVAAIMASSALPVARGVAAVTAFADTEGSPEA